MNLTATDKRRHPRHPCSDMVEFKSQSYPQKKTLPGACVNISDAGMCIYTFDYLAEGESIEIVNSSHKKAMVKWVKECCDDFYKIGIMFIK